jgi:hypothetical protein
VAKFLDRGRTWSVGTVLIVGEEKAQHHKEDGKRASEGVNDTPAATKAKPTTLSTEQQSFVTEFLPAASKIDKKKENSGTSCQGSDQQSQGARCKRGVLSIVSGQLRCNSGNLPHFVFVLRALMTTAPNSCPPERVFSMFNATFGEDQKKSFGDYIELAMHSQYNKRNL